MSVQSITTGDYSRYNVIVMSVQSIAKGEYSKKNSL